MKQLEGIFSALPFPFTSSGQFNRAVFVAHIRDSLAAGVHGFWVNGATAGSVFLNVEQRREALEVAAETVAGRVPVLAMVSALNITDGIALAKQAQEAGVAGISAMPPLIYPTDVAQIVSYLRALKETTSLPMAYYHVPGLTKVSLSAAQLCELCEQVPLSAVKYSETDFFKAIEVLHRCPNVTLLTGFEELLLGGLAMRCVSGTVGASQNFMPGPLVDLFEAFHNGDLDKAQRLHAGIARVAAVQGMVDFTAATYAILNLLGYGYGHPVPPLRRLNGEEIGQLKSALLAVIRPDPLNEHRLIESQDLLFAELVPCGDLKTRYSSDG
jgi:dihydrodipicolinate synthase/N-acetylneuraminate lyase